MFELDHIAITCADLETGTTWLSEALGVPLLAGGQHARFGTHNRLLGLEDGLYLEVIAPDPAAKISGPRWFELDHAPVTPRWGNWICRADDLDKNASITGPAIDMSRGDLKWQITVPADGALPMQGGFPTLIRWDETAAHPASKLPYSRCRLTRWEVHHPQAGTLRDLCAIADPRIVFVQSDAVRFLAQFETPSGSVTL